MVWDDDEKIMEQSEIGNNINELEQFRSRYIDLNPEIALEVSTTGKYIAGKLRDMGFHVHLADPFKLSIIFKSSKKNDREDSYKLVKCKCLSKMSEEQKELLKEKLKNGQYTTAQVRIIIMEQFGIEYTMKQVWVIIKKMGMRHAKPYPHDKRRPGNAEDTLKKIRYHIH